MVVQFICRGNAFRSRMAEAYFNSLNIKGISAVSSGTVAKLHSESNAHNFIITEKYLKENGLAKFTKPNWDQLTRKLLNSADLTVFMNQKVADECNKLYGLSDNFIVWDIPDFDEIKPIPMTQNEIENYVKNTFNLIKSKVDELIKTNQLD